MRQMNGSCSSMISTLSGSRILRSQAEMFLSPELELGLPNSGWEIPEDIEVVLVECGVW